MPPRPTLTSLNNRITRCNRCPRLRAHCKAVAKNKTARYRNDTYWGKPVPNLLPDTKDPHTIKLLIVGLAPGAHGANRTGRMFTGDRSGDFLYRAMYDQGLCNQPESTHTGDGLTLYHTAIASAAHCAPPDNKPTTQELKQCEGFLDQTFDLLPGLTAVLSLGQIAHKSVLKRYQRLGYLDRLNRFPFAHGAVFPFDDAPTLLCCYHPSQQNTFTGRLTQRMLGEVLGKARELADWPNPNK